jgi:hypothetical protein
MRMTIMRVIISMLQDKKKELIITVTFPAVVAVGNMIVAVEVVEAMRRDVAAKVGMMANMAGMLVNMEEGEGTMEEAAAKWVTLMNIIVVLVQTLDKLITLVNVEEGESTMEDAAAEVAIMMKIIGVLVQTLNKLITLVNVEEGEGTMEEAVAKRVTVMNIIVVLVQNYRQIDYAGERGGGRGYDGGRGG